MATLHPTQKQIEKWQQNEIRKLKKAIKQELKDLETFHEDIRSKRKSDMGICSLARLEGSFKGILSDVRARRQAFQKSYDPLFAYDPHNTRKLYDQLAQSEG